MPSSHRIMAGGMSKPKPLDAGAKAMWAKASKLKSSKLPSGYLGTLGDPIYVETQVVAGINYRFTFKNGMQVTVNNAPWRNPPISIVGVSHTRVHVTTAAKPDDSAGLHLTQLQRKRALAAFKKQDVNHDGTITNGGAYTALMSLESKEDQKSTKICPGWEEVTQRIVGSNPRKTIRIDQFMRKYTDFEVGRRAMKYFSSFAGKDCVLYGRELQDGLHKTFGTSVTKEQMLKIIKKYDQDKKPTISFQEFYAMYKDYAQSISDKPNKGKGDAGKAGTLNDREATLAEKGWNALDTSKDGYVENREFSAKYKTIVDRMKREGKGSKELLGNLDDYFTYFAGKDGKLSHVEYLKMMEVMKEKTGQATFDQFLDTLTTNNCGQLRDCYKCVAADMACAWLPKSTSSIRYRTPRKTDGKCVEAKTAKLLGAVLLRGAPVSSGSYTTQSQCGKAYDPRPHIYDGIMPPIADGMRRSPIAE